MDLLTLKEAEELCGIEAHSLMVAIRKNRLKTYRKDGNQRHLVSRKELLFYAKNKYDRSEAVFQGQLKFDKKKGEYNVTQACKYLGVNRNWVYLLIRRGILNHIRKGCSYVVFKSDLDRVKENSVVN